MKVGNLYIGNICSLQLESVQLKAEHFSESSITILPKYIKRSLFYKRGNHVYDLLDKNKHYKVRDYEECQKIRLINKKIVMHCQFVGDRISDEKRLSKRKIISIYNERIKEK